MNGVTIGIFLAVVGASLVVVDLLAPGPGIATAGWIAAFVGSGVSLYLADRPWSRIAAAAIFGVAAAAILLVPLVARAAVHARRQPAVGPGAVVGSEGVVVRKVSPAAGPPDQMGVVHVAGETHTATSSEVLAVGTRVRVTARRGLLVEVEPLQPRPAPARRRGKEGA